MTIEYKYLFDHNYEPDKTMIVDKLIQLVSVTGIKYRTLQTRLSKTNDYYDPCGKFRIRKIVYIKYRSKRGDRSRLPKFKLVPEGEVNRKNQHYIDEY